MNAIQFIKEHGVEKARDVVEGFITSELEFLDREQAMQLALGNGQIKAPLFNSRELFSEDLW